MAENELIKDEFYKQIDKQKKIVEAQFVFSLYKNVDLFWDYEVKTGSYSWSDINMQQYYILLYRLLENGIRKVDVVSVNNYIENIASPKQRDWFVGNNGYKTIDKGIRNIESDNVQMYFDTMFKYHTVQTLHEDGYPIERNWERLKNKPLEDIADFMEGSMNKSFYNVQGRDKVVDIKSGLDEMIEKANKGLDYGLPLASPLLNNVQNGLSLGNITILGANSGVGKSFLVLTQILPTIINNQERVLIVINEEDKTKWQRDLLTYYINNKLGKRFNKGRFLKGNFTNEEMKWILEAKEMLEHDVADGLIQLVEMGNFNMADTIRLIRAQNRVRGVQYFVIDTLKLDSNYNENGNMPTWLSLQENMRKLYDAIKPKALNVHCFVTYQLGKSAMNKRYLTSNELGMSKNIVDVASSVILARTVSQEEKGNGKKAFTVKFDTGIIGNLPDDEKEYMILFFDKNRQGQTDTQVVMEVDRGRQITKDVGIAHLNKDLE